MFAFITIAAKLRAAQAALASRDFHAVAAMAADLLDTLGMDSLAAHVRGELAGIGTGDAREIAVNALGVVADIVNAVFGFGKPIVVSAAPPGVDDLAHKCERAAASCEASAHNKAASPGDANKAIDPAMLQMLLAFAAQILSAWFSRRSPQPA